MAHWKDVFDAYEVPAAPIQNALQVLDDPQVQALGQLEAVTLPGHGGTVSVPRPPLEFSLTPGKIWGRRLALGEHGLQILQEAGYTAAEIADLVAGGVCGTPRGVTAGTGSGGAFA